MVNIFGGQKGHEGRRIVACDGHSRASTPGWFRSMHIVIFPKHSVHMVPGRGSKLIFFHTYEGKILGQVEPGRGKALCGQLSGVDLKVIPLLSPG